MEKLIGPIVPPPEPYASWEKYSDRRAAWLDYSSAKGNERIQKRRLADDLGLNINGSVKYLTVDSVFEALKSPGAFIPIGDGKLISRSYLPTIAARAARIDRARFGIYFEPVKGSRGLPYLMAIPLSERPIRSSDSTDLTRFAWGDFGPEQDFSPTSESVLYLAYGYRDRLFGCYAGVTTRGLLKRTKEHLSEKDYSFDLGGSLAWELPSDWSTLNAAGQVALAEGLLIHTLVRSLDGYWLENRRYPSKIKSLSDEQVDSVMSYMTDRVYPLVQNKAKVTLDPEPRPTLALGRKQSDGGYIHAFTGGTLAGGGSGSVAERNGWRVARPRFRQTQ